MSKDNIGITILGPGELTIGETASLHNMSNQVIECKLVPKVDKGNTRIVLSGKERGGSRKESWTLEGKFLFDAGTAESTSDFLFDKRGQDMPFSFTPAAANGNKYTGTLTVESAEIGGEVGEETEVDFEFSLVGVPAKTKAAVVPGG